MGCELNNCQFYAGIRDIANESTAYGQSVHSVDQIERAQELRNMSNICVSDRPNDPQKCAAVAAALIINTLSNKHS
jgi:hypothetical protein